MIKLIMACFTFCLCRKSINWENTKPFIPNIKSAKVIKVYDGDTIPIAAKIHPLDMNYYRFSIKFFNVFFFNSFTTYSAWNYCYIHKLTNHNKLKNLF